MTTQTLARALVVTVAASGAACQDSPMAPSATSQAPSSAAAPVEGHFSAQGYDSTNQYASFDGGGTNTITLNGTERPARGETTRHIVESIGRSGWDGDPIPIPGPGESCGFESTGPCPPDPDLEESDSWDDYLERTEGAGDDDGVDPDPQPSPGGPDEEWGAVGREVWRQLLAASTRTRDGHVVRAWRVADYAGRRFPAHAAGDDDEDEDIYLPDPTCTPGYYCPPIIIIVIQPPNSWTRGRVVQIDGMYFELSGNGGHNGF